MVTNTVLVWCCWCPAWCLLLGGGDRGVQQAATTLLFTPRSTGLMTLTLLTGMPRLRTSQVSLPRIPSLSSFCAVLKPCVMGAGHHQSGFIHTCTRQQPPVPSFTAGRPAAAAGSVCGCSGGPLHTHLHPPSPRAPLHAPSSPFQ